MNSAQSEMPAASASVASMPRRRRPFGLYMILVLLSLQAITGFAVTALLGIGIFFDPGTVWTAIQPELVDLVLSLLLIPVTAVVLVGLWRYRTWGWYGMMLLLAYYTASDAIAYFSGRLEPVSMFFNVLMVFYLNQREVRDLFEQTAVTETTL